MSRHQQSNRDFAVDVVKQLRDAGFQALWAGGCVRDLVLDHDPSDYDVATTATPEEVRLLFGKKRTVPVGASFGVMLVLGPDGVEPIEVATFRREGEYLDGRRPESVEYCTPEEDALRRDFTINGMFFDPLTETIHDYVGGEEDLRRRVLRCIGDPEDRFAEDKLRMLRAVRFATRFGFDVEASTAEAIQKHVSEITVVSVERITQELLKMLGHDHRRQAVELSETLGLWPVILPELVLPVADSSERHDLMFLLQQLEGPSPELVLVILGRHLSLVEVAEFARRLKLSNEQRQRMAWLLEHLSDLHQPQDLPLHKLKRLLSSEYRDDLLEYTRANELILEGSIRAYEFCDHYLKCTPPEVLTPEPFLTGDDFIQAGMKPGIEFKTLLQAVIVAQLDESIHSTDDAWRLIKQLQGES
ncbi:CCA tRNA nucleotidyltransferase [Planctomycetaceae bacterium]|jgi:poly(A) polymerase|nr:CCA tRNA nucleotidyltransferase [Planctomycetaceae bacterium]MDB4786739.1 CCA tRNA nucleotidyltransferase [Planctomycetaceae bacterium]MDC0308186.1 CCA tRNA nucleotidyltransferase [Planctomycetaceae bacterium]